MRRPYLEERPPSIRDFMAFEEHAANARAHVGRWGGGTAGQPPKPTRWASVSTST
jgi:hypothetical protein